MKYLCILLVTLAVPFTLWADNCSVTVGSMEISQSVPDKVSIGEEYVNNIELRAQTNVRRVQAVVFLSPNMEYVKSVPPAEQTGDTLTWNYDQMSAGEKQGVKLWLRAASEGELTTCATVSSIPVCCATTFAGKATLVVEKTGPATATVGQKVTYTIIVKNTGSAAARDVKLIDRVPEELAYSKTQDRKEIRHSLGNLQPGASKTFTLSLFAVARGTACNVVEITSSNAETVSDQACTEIRQLGAELVLQCRNVSYIGKNSKNSLIIRNTGDAPLTNAVVVVNMSDKLKVTKTSIPGEGYGSRLTWKFDEIKPGETKTIDIIVISKHKGKHCVEASMKTAEGLQKSANCCTQWQGFAAILIEMIDTEDPLIVNEETTYIIKITNQGTADDHDVKIHVQFPQEISPISASGATRGTVEGKRVDFQAYAVFRPKQIIEFRVRAKGVSTGDARVRVFLTSELLKKPVPEEESTHVY
ncbi:hypothetical protein [Candidatus Uabimicrobium sp. HlEnr_7]|uniref:DUF7507 domain-containing protein n=1 Tax=Candidatus Uabimicrobium helgolandensis TaxID=3095367 RepID=UPI0035578FD9